MQNCGPNTLFIPTPLQTSSGAVVCNPTCGSVGLTTPLDENGQPLNLGPRRAREVIREQLKDYVLLMLGAPVLGLELDQQQLDLAVDEALMIFEDYAPRDYFQYYIFNTIPGQSVYKMPDDVGAIRAVMYKQTPVYAFSASDLGGVIPLEYMGAGAYGSLAGGINPQIPIWGQMSDWVVYKEYEFMYSRLASQIGGWEWLGGSGPGAYIKLYPIPFRSHGVIVHYLQTRANFRKVTQAMQEGALAFAKQIVGRIRTRIANPPGPNGGLQLDGQQILQEGLEAQTKWEERLITRYGDLPIITLG